MTELNKFWKGFKFALECAAPDGSNPTKHLKKTLETQTRYTQDDVELVLFPVLSKEDMVVTSCSYLTEKGEEALNDLINGKLPVLGDNYKHKQINVEEATERASRTYYDGDDDFFTDIEGYVTFLNAMLDVYGFYSAFEDMQWYFWNQVLKILKEENPVVQDILEPYIVRFKTNKKLEEFLTEKLANKEKFNVWFYYAQDLCPVP